MWFSMGKRYGKAFQMKCERITELELQIDFAKKFNLDYTNQKIELDKLYRELDGGVVYETSSKKNKKTNRRLF